MGGLALRPDGKRGHRLFKQSGLYFLTTSYKGQLLEITFATNLMTDPQLKAEIDQIMDSIRLEE